MILKWLITAASLYVAAWLVPGIEVLDTKALLLAALVIGLVNVFVKPLAVLLTLPLTFLTLGLFYLVVNGAMLYLAAAVSPGFELSGFGAAILGALVVSIVSGFLHGIVRRDDG